MNIQPNVNRIELFVDAGMWQARFAGPHASQIRQLFYTDVLPTAFASSVNSLRVQVEVEKLNPGVRVEVKQ